MSQMGWQHLREQDDEQLIDPGMQGRLYFLRLVIISILLLLVYRVFWLQQNRGAELQALSDENQFAELRNSAPRGVVFDRNGIPLAVNLPSFDVTITPAFLPKGESERQAIYQHLSFLTGVPVTNTVAQANLIEDANPELISTYSRLAELYNEPVLETLDLTGIVPLLPDSIEEIVNIYSFAPYLPAVITSNIPITLAYAIEQDSTFLPGVRVISRPLRDYPTGALTSHIIGFMGPIPNESWIDRGYQRNDRVGWAGLEIFMEGELSGKKGERIIEVDWSGREIRQIGQAIPAIAGQNLYLTIDVALQQAATDILLNVMQKRRETPDNVTGEPVEVEQAALIVLNPNTGEILAMVNVPGFDNNRFATEVPVDYYLGLARNEYTPLVNHAISGQYPPGSVFKLVTAAAAMQEGIISPGRYLDTPGKINIPNRFSPNDPGRAQTFVCWKLDGHGKMNMWLGIANSCDIYFYKITGGFDQDGEQVDALGIDRLADYAQQFGFGRIQGIELPLETKGNIPTQAWKRQTYGEPWSTGDDYNASIGQGFVTSTPLQVAQMAAVIANGGYLYQPTIIHHMTDENGTITKPFEPVVIGSVDVDRAYLEVIAEGMRLVNTESGTAGDLPWLDAFGISSAGKTGSAEYCDNIAIKRRWCKEGQILPTHAWYVGYAPYNAPEIVVATFIFNGGEGSTWSGRATSEVMQAYFELQGIIPTD